MKRDLIAALALALGFSALLGAYAALAITRPVTALVVTGIAGWCLRLLLLRRPR